MAGVDTDGFAPAGLDFLEAVGEWAFELARDFGVGLAARVDDAFGGEIGGGHCNRIIKSKDNFYSAFRILNLYFFHNARRRECS